jgi:hypothetical protein
MVMMFVGGVVLLLTEFLYYSYSRNPTGREFFVPAQTLIVVFLLNYLSYIIKTSLLAYSLIYDVIQCSGFDGDCDNLAAGKIRREAHRPMERIGGFMRSH